MFKALNLLVHSEGAQSLVFREAHKLSLIFDEISLKSWMLRYKIFFPISLKPHGIFQELRLHLKRAIRVKYPAVVLGSQ
jgi:hypothetical protein